MAKEHHCPNCGPQACNASTSKIHTCGVCAAVWEEVLGEGAPTAPPTTPKPVATSAVPLAKPAPPTAPSPPPAAAKPANPGPSPSGATAPKPSAATVASPPPPAPVAAAPPPGATKPLASPGDANRTPGRIALAKAVAAAKVKRCPRCTSDSLAAPSAFHGVAGRTVLVDSQSYRGHHWFADTGEPYEPPSAAPTPTAPAKPASPAALPSPS